MHTPNKARLIKKIAPREIVVPQSRHERRRYPQETLALDGIQHPDLPWRRSIFRTRRDPWNVLPVTVLALDQTLKMLLDTTNAMPR